MRQVIQSLKTGQIELIETPIPAAAPGQVTIKTYASIISKGTEESLLEFGKASFIKKAQLQPDKVEQIKAKLKTDGVAATLSSVQSKLEKPITPGYSQSGIVVSTGESNSPFSVGDRVISNGPHAEFVTVPYHLCVKIPNHSTVSFEEAAFTPIASIALQSIRLLNPSLGETVVVQGLGLIGLVTVQLLKAQGCRVLGIDFEGPRLELARSFGAEVHNLSQDPNPVPRAMTFSKGHGVDGVIIAAATLSSEPVHFAAQMSRKRGKIVLLGATGTHLHRSDFYEKELSFQVSCSYGPGRYDRNYEQKGLDYPIGYVRWTEERNMEAILTLIQEQKLNLKPLISHRFPFSDSIQAYQLLTSNQYSNAIVLSYPIACKHLSPPPTTPSNSFSQRTLKLAESIPSSPRIALIGAGDHTLKVILPSLRKLGAPMHLISSPTGLSAAMAAKKYGISEVTSDSIEAINSTNIDTVIITSRHDSHASLVIEAIRAQKNIFIEKPLAITLDQLDLIEKAIVDFNFSKSLKVGFNRRYSSLSQKLKSLLDSTPGPKQMVYTVNALSLPESHWIHDSTLGGGRIISELGHFIDLLRFFAGSSIVDFSVTKISSEIKDPSNSLTASFQFQDGSLGTLIYSTLGNRNYPKENLEIFSGGKVAVIDNFKKLTGFGFNNFSQKTLWSQDKGHVNCLSEFIKSIKEEGFSPLGWRETLEVSRITCKLSEFKRSTLQEPLL